MIKVVTLPIKPAPGRQSQFFNSLARYTVAVIGRQFGKTTLALLRLTKRAVEKTQRTGRPGAYWFCSPTKDQARKAFNQYVNQYSDLVMSSNITHNEIKLLTGDLLQFRGTEEYDNLRGATLDGAILDECATMRPEVWPEAIRPMLGVRRGWCDFLGTPKGKNWFYHIYNYGLKHPDRFYVMNARSCDSPYFSMDEYEEAKRTTPQDIFSQEYDAEFIDAAGEVFRNIDKICTGTRQPPQPFRQYVMGVDLARKSDFTVITVFDVAKKSMVYFERFNDLSWAIQKERVLSVCREYNNAYIMLDATGVGDPIAEDLQRSRAPVEPVVITAANKSQMIERMIVSMEKGECQFLSDQIVLDELKAFESRKLPSGRLQYSAPAGLHDDIVMSIALAWWRISAGTEVARLEDRLPPASGAWSADLPVGTWL